VFYCTAEFRKGAKGRKGKFSCASNSIFLCKTLRYFSLALNSFILFSFAKLRAFFAVLRVTFPTRQTLFFIRAFVANLIARQTQFHSCIFPRVKLIHLIFPLRSFAPSLRFSALLSLRAKLFFSFVHSWLTLLRVKLNSIRAFSRVSNSFILFSLCEASRLLCGSPRYFPCAPNSFFHSCIRG
jgi:hypothetical protein